MPAGHLVGCMPSSEPLLQWPKLVLGQEAARVRPPFLCLPHVLGDPPIEADSKDLHGDGEEPVVMLWSDSHASASISGLKRRQIELRGSLVDIETDGDVMASVARCRRPPRDRRHLQRVRSGSARGMTSSSQAATATARNSSPLARCIVPMDAQPLRCSPPAGRTCRAPSTSPVRRAPIGPASILQRRYAATHTRNTFITASQRWLNRTAAARSAPGGRFKLHRARVHLRAPHASSAPRPSPGALSIAAFIAAMLLCGGCT